MPTLRDALLPLVDSIRTFEAVFGTRRFGVVVRRRVWSGGQPGEGTPTDTNITITPRPRVRDVTVANLTPGEAEALAMSSNKVTGQMYRIEQITPHYTPATSGQPNGATGGYFAEQLRLWPNRDYGGVENLVSLVGDDGYLRECVQVTFEQDRMVNYKMLVKEYDRPRTQVQSVALSLPTGSTGPLAAITRQQAQLTLTGTYAGGATGALTALALWQSSNASVATVDIFGNVTAVAAGTTSITATVLGQSAQIQITVQ